MDGLTECNDYQDVQTWLLPHVFWTRGLAEVRSPAQPCIQECAPLRCALAEVAADCTSTRRIESHCGAAVGGCDLSRDQSDREQRGLSRFLFLLLRSPAFGSLFPLFPLRLPCFIAPTPSSRPHRMCAVRRCVSRTPPAKCSPSPSLRRQRRVSPSLYFFIFF